MFRDHAEKVSFVRKESALSPRQFQRPDKPKLPDGRSNSSSALTEDHFNINDVANVLERPRLKGAMSTSIPNDISTTCRTSWCGGVERKAKSRRTTGQFICRGDVTNLQKRAAECSMIVCPGLTKTRLWKDQPWKSESPNRRWRQIWCLCCKRSSQVSVYGREEKGVPMSTASVSCWHVYVTSLWSASLDFVPEAPVWRRATRRSGNHMQSGFDAH